MHRTSSSFPREMIREHARGRWEGGPVSSASEGSAAVELTPGILIVVVAVAIAVSIVLVRWMRRHEAAPPLDAPRSSPVGSPAVPATAERDSQSLVRWLLDRASEETGVRVADDPLAHQRIVEAAARAMEDLRTHGSATVSVPFLVADARGPKHFDVRVKRNPDSTFELQR